MPDSQKDNLVSLEAQSLNLLGKKSLIALKRYTPSYLRYGSVITGILSDRKVNVNNIRLTDGANKTHSQVTTITIRTAIEYIIVPINDIEELSELIVPDSKKKF